MTNDEQLLTVEDVAELFSVTTDTIYRWSRAGRIPAYKIEGTWRYKKNLLNFEPSLVLFKTQGCSLCDKMAEILERLQENYEVSVTRISAEESPELVERQEIDTFPTILFHEGPDKSKRATGLIPYDMLVDWVGLEEAS